MSSDLASYDFHLPNELIAQDPAARRGDSRMLLVEPGAGLVDEVVFRRLPELLQAGDLLVLNESRVLPARLRTQRVDTGGQVEILLIRPHTEPGHWLAMARPARRLRAGVQLSLSGEDSGPLLTVVETLGQGQVLVKADQSLPDLAEKWGEIPLPPYIRRQADEVHDGQRAEQDRQRYQTVFAKADTTGAGSVAAPTAGLHFSEATLAALQRVGVDVAHVCLHVGPGTFQPPSDEQIQAKRLHREFLHLPAATNEAITRARSRGGRIIAVGTTSLRVLETVARLDLPETAAGELALGPTVEDPDPVFSGRAQALDGHWDVAGSTRLFINPPDRISAADGLLTNFHLPGSSLLMLVAALTGPKIWRPVYDHAVAQKLRFYSYGDCMLILPGLNEKRIQP